jgi:hypothetical protein
MSTGHNSDERRQPRPTRRAFLSGLLAGVALGLTDGLYEKRLREPPAFKNPGVTITNYDRLTSGMSYQSVVDILGTPGQVQERSESAGITSVTYLWVRDRSGANLSVKFNDDKLAVKTQYGLR